LRTLNGIIERDLIVRDKIQLLGILKGQTYVKKNGVFILNGSGYGDVFVEVGGMAYIHGQLNGNIYNKGGYLKMTGRLKGNIIEEGGLTKIDSESDFNGKLIKKGKAEERFYSIDLNFELPLPWINKNFSVDKIGYLNFLVGPNGTGKTRFAEVLQQKLAKCRMLRSDRMAGLEKLDSHGPNILHSTARLSSEGIAYKSKKSYKEEAEIKGIGGDAFVILEENLVLRIKICAILSQYFSKKFRFEMRDGFIVPMAYSIRDGSEYEMHTEECHGIRELIILLTYLYDDRYDFLLIDEPELNLHPQYQFFLMQHIRVVIGNPEISGKKIIFLITHSPYILDIQSIVDIKSIVSFSPDFEEPAHLYNIDDDELMEFSSIIPRLNGYNKQFLFSHTPIFVEGEFDATIIRAIQEKRGFSIEGSGSCLIEAGGNKEVSLFFKLVLAFKKKAFFIYDLNSIFTRFFRESLHDDKLIVQFLAKLGVGSELKIVFSEFERELSSVIKKILDVQEDKLDELKTLKKYCDELQTKDIRRNNQAHKKMRIALLVQLEKSRNGLLEILEEEKILFIEAKLKNILDSFKLKNVYVLRGGSLENYLPSYKGNIYEINDDLKKKTVETELTELTHIDSEMLESRYGYLYEVISNLPGYPPIDYLFHIENYLADFIFKLQKGIFEGCITSVEDVEICLKKEWNLFKQILIVDELNVVNRKSFRCKIIVLDRWGLGIKKIELTEKNNPALNDFNYYG
jgi:hypothetical protein